MRTLYIDSEDTKVYTVSFIRFEFSSSTVRNYDEQSSKILGEREVDIEILNEHSEFNS